MRRRTALMVAVLLVAGTTAGITVHATWSGFTALAAGADHSCALIPTGATDWWGRNNAGQAEDQTVHVAGTDSHTYSIAVSDPTGLLRVTTDPAVPAEMIVDGVPATAGA